MNADPAAQRLLADVLPAVRSALVSTETATDHGFIEPGPVEIDYWSITAPLLLKGVTRYYLKLPKTEARAHDIAATRTSAARDAGAAEFAALRRIREVASRSGLSYVDPIIHLPQVNALITRYVEGRHLDEMCRRDPSATDAKTRASLTAVGRWLRDYHDATVIAETALDAGRPIDLEPDIRGAKDGSFESRVDSIPGFEVRNLLVGEPGRVFLVDPGEIHMDDRSADIARFIVSLELLYWGTVWFPFRDPGAALRVPFLSGYGWPSFGAREPERVRLHQERVRARESAREVVTRIKCYPSPLRGLVRVLYVELPYRRRLQRT